MVGKSLSISETCFTASVKLSGFICSMISSALSTSQECVRIKGQYAGDVPSILESNVPMLAQEIVNVRSWLRNREVWSH